MFSKILEQIRKSYGGRESSTLYHWKNSCK